MKQSRTFNFFTVNAIYMIFSRVPYCDSLQADLWCRLPACPNAGKMPAPQYYIMLSQYGTLFPIALKVKGAKGR
jgi:hypothetical protein